MGKVNSIPYHSIFLSLLPSCILEFFAWNVMKCAPSNLELVEACCIGPPTNNSGHIIFFFFLRRITQEFLNISMFVH